MIFGKYVNRFYLKYFFNFLLGIIFLIVVDIVQLQVPEIIAALSKHNDAGTLTNEIITNGAQQIFFVAIFMFLGRFTWRVCILNGAFSIAADLREDMFKKCLKLSQRYYQDNKVGAIMAYYTNDIETIQESYGWGTVMLVDAIFLSGLSFYKMMKVNLTLALICLVPIVLLGVFAYFIDKKMDQIYDERQKAYSSMSDYAQELFTGLRVIKAFVREIIEARRFKKVNQENKQKELNLVKFSAGLDTAFHILIQVMIVIGLSVGAYFAYETLFGFDYNFGRSDMIEFNGYINTIIWPMMALGQIVALRARAKTSLKRISKLLDETIEIEDLNNIINMNEVQGKITFKNFSFKYPNKEQYILKNITLTINPGENIGIVGRLGCGKTTLINALTRLYNLQENQVYIDDVDIMKLPINKVRDNISYVPQDNFLFSTSVEDNVGFAYEKLNEEQIIEACKFADVHNNITDFINGYKTLVGERGVSLSGGQKQRISIARAYIKDTPIMILDDSLSAIDVKTEETLLKNIKEKRKGKTTIIVASRVSTVKHLDRIIVLNNGELEAFDTNENLMKISPTYKTMAELQKLEDEVEGGDF